MKNDLGFNLAFKRIFAYSEYQCNLFITSASLNKNKIQMKKLNIFFSFLTIAFFTNFSTDAQRVVGTGPIVSETVKMSEISNIGLGISANVYITQGSSQSIEIKGQQNIIDLINKKAKGDTWDIKFPRNTNIKSNEKLEVYITIRDIESLNLGGSGSIIGEGRFKNIEDLNLNIGGSGSIKLALQAEELTCNIGGSGSMHLEGSADDVDINIGGSGSVKALDLKVANAKVNAAGSGSVQIDVSDKLNATIVGSGGVKYKGNPEINKTIMGSGRLKAI